MAAWKNFMTGKLSIVKVPKENLKIERKKRIANSQNNQNIRIFWNIQKNFKWETI